MIKSLKQSVLILMAILALVLNSCMPDIEPMPEEYSQKLEEGKFLEFDEIMKDCNEIKALAEEYGSGYEDNPFAKHCQEYDVLLEKSKEAQNALDQMMLQIKSDDTPPDKEKLNLALMLAATAGDLKTLNQLIQMGADPNAENMLHMTALMSAANSIHPECVDALLKAGANPNVKDTMGSTALLLASNNRFNYQSVRMLIKGGADVNYQTPLGTTALYIASLSGCTQCMYDLIKAGADVNVAEPVNDITPLLIVSRGLFSEAVVAVELLIDAGADVNVKTKEEEITPLHVGIDNPGGYIALLLLKAGANPNVTSKDGKTPYSIMMSNGSTYYRKDEDETFIETDLYKAMMAAKARRLFIF